MVKQIIQTLKLINKGMRLLFPDAFQIEKKFPGGFPELMDKSQALLILNIKGDSNEQEIMKQHRRLMILNHPDKGGSTYITLKINEAKNILLQKDQTV